MEHNWELNSYQIFKNNKVQSFKELQNKFILTNQDLLFFFFGIYILKNWIAKDFHLR